MTAEDFGIFLVALGWLVPLLTLALLQKCRTVINWLLPPHHFKRAADDHPYVNRQRGREGKREREERERERERDLFRGRKRLM